MKRILVVIVWCIIAQGQTKPTEHKLPPEASKAIIQLEAQKKAFNDDINEKEGYVLLGANVPADSRQCSWDASQIVICVKPVAAKASPAK